MCREVVRDVVWVSSGHRGTDRAHDLLGGVGVLRCHVVAEGGLGEAELGAERAGEGLRRGIVC